MSKEFYGSIEREHLISGSRPHEVYRVVTDYPGYPQVFSEFREVQVLKEAGAHQRVEFLIHVLINIRLVLDIHHDEATLATDWHLVESNLISDLSGGWRFIESGADTRLILTVGATPRSGVSAWLISKATRLILSRTLPGVFQALEQEVLARQSR